MIWKINEFEKNKLMEIVQKGAQKLMVNICHSLADLVFTNSVYMYMWFSAVQIVMHFLVLDLCILSKHIIIYSFHWKEFINSQVHVFYIQITLTVYRYALHLINHANLTVNIPDNNCIEGLTDGMAEAWKIYGQKE